MNSDDRAPLEIEEGTHLLDYINVILRRWKVVLLVFLLVFCGVAVKTWLTRPVYEAAVTLKVNKNSQGGVLKGLTMDSNDSLASDIELIRSRSLAEEVARRLHLDWRTGEISPGLSWRLEKLTVDDQTTALVVELTGPDSYRLRSEGGKVLGEGRSGEELTAGGVTLSLEILGGRAGARLRLERLPLIEVAGGVMDGIVAMEMGKGTDMLRLSFQGTDPVRAREIVNTLAQVYRDQSMSSKTREASKTVGFIDDQLTGLKTNLDRTEQALQEFKVQSGLTTLGPEGQGLVAKVVDLEDQKAKLDLQHKRLEFAIDEVRRAIRNGASYSPSVLDSVPLSKDIAGQLADLEAQKKTLLEDFTPAHPAVIAAQQNIRKAEDALLAVYQAGLKDLEFSQQDLAETMAGYDKQLEGIPRAELELAKRTRVNQVNADLYTFLLQKQQEARIAQASTLSNVDIVDPAYTPTVPIKPNKKKNLALGLVLGLMAGVGSAFLLDYLDDTVKDADDVKHRLGLPVLGIIPRIATPSGAADDPAAMLIRNLEPKSPPVEAFRALRTGIHYATAREKRKILLVTSSLPDEGKTTVSANLALVLAQTGSRVLLVGCDLRRPGLYDMFHTPKTPGLSDLLTGSAKDCCHRIPGTTLDLISAGTVPPNPAELLGSERMEKFLDYVRGRYDYVVLDAPPVLPVTDAQVLASLVDDVIVILEPCRVPRKAAQRMAENLRAVEAKIIGVALNDKSGKGFKYYGNYGYYGHKYYGGYYGESLRRTRGGAGRQVEEDVGIEESRWWRATSHARLATSHWIFMIDYHCHILPALDDGAADLAESLAMARLLAAAGYREICCTPHCMRGSYDYAPGRVREAVAALQGELERAGIPVRLRPGMEYYLDEYFVELAELQPLGDSRLALVEAPQQANPLAVRSGLEKVLSLGLTPLVAHPERSQIFFSSPELLAARHEVLFQGNLGSFTGFYGPNVQRRAYELLRAGRYAVFGSDGHDAVRLGGVLEQWQEKLEVNPALSRLVYGDATEGMARAAAAG